MQKEEKIKEEMNELKQKTRSSMELMMKEEAESNSIFSSSFCLLDSLYGKEKCCPLSNK